MRRVKDFAQKMIEFMQDKINRLRKMKRKNKWKLAASASLWKEPVLCSRERQKTWRSCGC